MANHIISENILLVITLQYKTLVELIPNCCVDDTTYLGSWFNFQKRSICFSMDLFTFMPFKQNIIIKSEGVSSRQGTLIWSMCFTTSTCWGALHSEGWRCRHIITALSCGKAANDGRSSAWGARKLGNTILNCSYLAAWP